MIDVKISYGDFSDRLSILRIKDAKSYKHSTKEQLALFEKILDSLEPATRSFVNISLSSLRNTNERLWAAEDAIRKAIELQQPDIVAEAAMLIIDLNDRRAELKNQLDEALGGIKDTKIYAGKSGYNI